MTDRLYYDDSYLKEFDATVTAVKGTSNGSMITLDRSAFYPTSGGQPFDTGSLNGIAVTDVAVKDGEVWHYIDGTLEVGQSVHGIIDWERRFDHMQQHGGEHMIAGAFYELTGGMTIGLHLGSEVSSIDVDFKDGSTRVSDETIRAVEDLVNRRIWNNDPIRCWFPEPEELAALPLRKKPTVTEHVRIVAIGDYEMVACGGTHPAATGQIGIVKILSALPERGKLRVSFVCGKRAFLDYRKCFDVVHESAKALTTSIDNLTDRVEETKKRLINAEREITGYKREQLLNKLQTMKDGAECLENGNRLICGCIDTDIQLLRDAASNLIEDSNAVVLLAAPNGANYSLVFACGKECGIHMGKLMSASAARHGGKGGGRNDFAQGGGSIEILKEAERMVKEN